MLTQAVVASLATLFALQGETPAAAKKAPAAAAAPAATAAPAARAAAPAKPRVPAAATPRPAAPASSVVGAWGSLVLAGPTTLRFSVQTNAGQMQGTIRVRRLTAIGLDGRGRFGLEIELDPERVDTGDAFWDRFISHGVLRADRGNFRLSSAERIAPPVVAEGAPPARASLVLQLSAPLAPGARRMDYGWEGDSAAGTLTVEHQATLEELGLLPLPHPFLAATGPVTLSLEARLSRGR